MTHSEDLAPAHDPSSLPYDILYSIFRILWAEDAANKSPTIPSQVCHSWRVAATESSLLWSTITFTSKPPFNREALWIGRSGDTGLDITIPRNYNYYATAQLIRLIKPHVARWKSLKITPTFKHASYRLIFDELQHDLAPMLEVLDVANFKNHSTWTFQPFTKGTPNIRELRITHCQLLAGSTMFDRLEELTISQGMAEPWPHPITIQDLLAIFSQSAQSLVKIRIRASSFETDSQPLARPVPIMLPRLTAIDLSSEYSQNTWVRRVYSSVIAPLIRWYNFNAGILLYLETCGTFPFPGLTSLNMAPSAYGSVDTLDPMHTAFFLRLPELQWLHVFRVDFAFQILGLQCPELKFLNVCFAYGSGLRWVGLKDMVQTRQRHAAEVGGVDSLVHLVLENVWLADEEVMWLRSNVQTFVYKIPATGSAP